MEKLTQEKCTGDGGNGEEEREPAARPEKSLFVSKVTRTGKPEGKKPHEKG